MQDCVANGGQLPLHIEEPGISGLATITGIEPCEPIADGEGSVVTGRFTTRRVDVLVRLEVLGPDGQVETIEGTMIQMIWFTPFGRSIARTGCR